MSRIRDIASMLTASSSMATDAEVTSSIASHAAAADPHTVYLKESEFNAAGKNAIINGAMDFWQRGTSTSTSQTFAADRWQAYLGSGTGTWSRQSVNDSTNLPNIQYCLRAQRNSGQTTTSIVYIWSNQETVNCIPYAGKTVTISYYARAGANFSSASNTLGLTVRSGTGTDQNAWLTGYTGGADTFATSVTLTTNWQRFSSTFTFPSTMTEFSPAFFYTPTGTAGASDYFEITGIQLELGSVATAFSRAGGSYPTELELCRRYYFEGYIAVISGGTNGIHGFLFMNPMRTTPSVTFEYDSINNRVYRMDNAVRYDLVSPTIIATPNALTTMYAFTPAGWAGSAGIGFNAYWRFNAEL